jgi:hypothetical protein
MWVMRSLTSAERNHSQIEREALAIIFGLQKFHCYLSGRKFTLLCDNKPLTLNLEPKKGIPVMAASRLQCWAIQLSAYQYEIMHCTSAQNANADGLSRCPQPENAQPAVGSLLTLWTEEATLLNVSQIARMPIDSKQISRVTTSYPVLSHIIHFMQRGWPGTEESAELLPYYRRKDKLIVEEGCLLWGIRVVVPTKFRSEIMDCLHDIHPGIVKMKSLARMHV